MIEDKGFFGETLDERKTVLEDPPKTSISGRSLSLPPFRNIDCACTKAEERAFLWEDNDGCRKQGFLWDRPLLTV